jgi:hypothetical protein
MRVRRSGFVHSVKPPFLRKASRPGDSERLVTLRPRVSPDPVDPGHDESFDTAKQGHRSDHKPSGAMVGVALHFSIAWVAFHPADRSKERRDSLGRLY